MTPEYFLIPIIITQVNQVISIMNTGNVIVDGLLFIIFYLMYKNVNFILCLHKLREKLRLKTINTIILTSECNEQTVNLKAVIYFITTYCKNAHTIREVIPRSVYYDETSNEVNGSYIIDQTEEFIIHNNISGILRKNVRNAPSHAGGTTYIEIEVTTLSIFSYKDSLYELREWINNCVKEYKIYLKTIYNESQLYVTISKPETKHINKSENFDGKRKKKVNLDDELSIESSPWVSNITFNNSYFNDMEAIVNNINFFLNNEEWYKSKGIPYNLGILLYGEPGCGKTRFIKQLMNHTKRHCIDIKLTDTMCYKDLCNILLKEEIDTELMIPINNRILVFEDIDALCDSVKSRDAIDKNILNTVDTLNTIPKTELNNAELLLNALLKPTNEQTVSTSAKLALSYLLNMLDGINESSGRIIIMTSNKPNVLDKALIRPGRIDLKIHFNKCTRFDIMKMINLFWEIDLSIDDVLDNIEMLYSSAEVYNIFRSSRTFDDIKHNFVKIRI